MTVLVDAGYVLTATGITEVAAASSPTISVAGLAGTEVRIDRVVIDLISGALSVVVGTEADPGPASPPDIPAGKAPCCQVALVSGQSAITNSDITDERAILNYGSINLAGGQWPSFYAYLSGGQNDIIGEDQILFNTTLFDTNNNYDGATNFRFQPTVPGKYLLTVKLSWFNSSVVAGDQLSLTIRNNVGGITGRLDSEVISANWPTQQALTVIVDADGSSNWYRITAINQQRDTGDIVGGIYPSFFCGSRVA